MSIITLTTDLGLQDYYVAAVKGNILSQLPDAKIVDITHMIPAFNIYAAAYIIKNAYPHFPKGSIHIIGVGAELSVESPHMIIEYDGHFFIGADNGVFNFLFDSKPENIFELNIRQDTRTKTFTVKDFLAKAACHIARGGTPEVIGNRINNYKERTYIKPALAANTIHGSVMYIDTYSNLILNVNKKLFKEIGGGRNFTIYFRSYKIKEISETYDDVPPGELLALFNAADHLELAQNKGQLGKQERIELNEMVTIQFE